jgi:S1-C subfamily serine protease
MSRSLVPALAVSAVLGAVVAIGAVELFDLGGGKTSTTDGRATGAAHRRSGEVGREQRRRRPDRSATSTSATPPASSHPRQVVEPASSPFDFGQQQQGEATGSGFVIAKDGTILTNAHVVENARKVRVQFADQRVETPRSSAADRSTDLAVLKVDPDGLELHPLTPGVVAGRPGRRPDRRDRQPLRPRAHADHGRGLGDEAHDPRPGQLPDRQRHPDDAAINPGQLGRPRSSTRRARDRDQLPDPHGGNGNGNIGIGFAVPIDTAKRVVPQLQRTGKVERGYLGVETRTVDRSLADLNLPAKSGALVQTVTPGSPAAKAGIHEGDIVAQLDGQAVASAATSSSRSTATRCARARSWSPR